MRKLKKYLLYIKSHSPAPDFEGETWARDKKEALKKFWGNGYGWLKAGWDKEQLEKLIKEDYEN